jgi:hypothetical protein
MKPMSSFSIVTGYGLGERGSSPDRGGEFLINPLRPAGSGFYPASCTMDTGELPGGKYGRDLLLTAHPLLVS